MRAKRKGKVCLTFGMYEDGRFVRRETFNHELINVGRDPKSHLFVDDMLAARRHAVIEVASANEITLIDLGSEPGTVVNGARVSKCSLGPGARLQIGGTLVVLENVDTGEDFGYALVKSGPDVNADDVELGHVDALEVMILWETTILKVQHLTPPRSYYVGEERGKNAGCDYFIPCEKLGTTRAPIVLAGGGALRVVILPGARGSIEIPGQGRMAFETALETGRAQPCAELSGAHEVALPPGGRARMEIDDLVFQVAAVRAGKPMVHGVFAGQDMSTYSYVGLSLVAHAGLIGAMASLVPPLGLTDAEGLSRDQIIVMQQFLQAAAEREAELVDRPTSENDADQREGGTGTRSVGEEGAMGNPNAARAAHRYGVEGPRDNPDPHVAKATALRNAAGFGLIGLLNDGMGGDPNAPTAIWGRDESLGNDPTSARGNMWGDVIGESFGHAGLGLFGVGEGGGGSGEGIGLGHIGTIGGGSGTGPGNGFGPGGYGVGHYPGRGAHTPGAPSLRIGEGVKLNGRIPREVIQRIVRQNYGRFRLCYENGLRTNPSLQGRVAVRFVIGRDGAVSNVSNGDSDLPDAAVVRCVIQAYYGLSFPEPEGGIVSVVYPIMFSPGS
jgi:hypothetical protein